VADARISVALGTRNGGAFVARQVASILQQRPAPHELVVGDDDSSDDTLAVIERVHAEARAADPTLPTALRIIRRRPALGVTANFAATLAACEGDLIALSDQDDEWMPGKLTALAEAFAADPGLLLAHSDARLVDGDGAPLGLTLLDALEATPVERAALVAGDVLPVLLRRNLVTGATVMLRRSLLDAALPIPGEWVHDEWLAAIAAATGRLRLVPEPLIDYRQHGANQIGARRPTLADKLARLREPRAGRAARLARRAALLAERGRALGVAAAVQEQLDAKADHEARRARLPRVRLARVPAVVAGAVSGRYGRYSRGAMDVLRDLATPAGEETR
jgi:glycosyltransferase involved in cell wall biosynthesis